MPTVQEVTKKAGVVRKGEGKGMNVLGHDVTVKLGYKAAGGDYYVFELASPAGAGVPPHIHEDEDEVIYVIEGTYQVFLGGQEITAGAGDLLHFPRGVPHGIANSGEVTGRTLWLVVPGEHFEAFFDEMGALPPGPPDVAQLSELFGRYNIELLPPPG